jgi:hypothetical protein
VKLESHACGVAALLRCPHQARKGLTESGPLLVLGIPGPWKSWTELVEHAVKRTDGRFIVAGRMLYEVEERRGFQLELQPRNERMRKAFEVAGSHAPLAADLLETIEHHQGIVYLKQRIRKPDDADVTLAAGCALLDFGGLAVNVESAGKAHSPEMWRELARTPAVSGLRAFVQHVGDENVIYSCGMHLLRLPDGSIEPRKEATDAEHSLPAFLAYLAFEHPELRDGQGFRREADAPRYLLEHRPSIETDPDSIRFNPFGTWRLHPQAL